MARFDYQCIWQQVSQNNRDEIITFWREHGAITDTATAQQRINQLVWIARSTADNQIAGVCTVMKRTVADLDHDLYYYRTFIAPPYRSGFIVRRLLAKTVETLEQWSQEHPKDSAGGVYLELENRAFARNLRHAVWKRKDLAFVYIGKTATGLERRVLWFKHTKI